MNNIPQGLGQLIAAQQTAQQAQQVLQQLQQTASMVAPGPQGQQPSVAGQIGQSLAQTAAALSPPPPQPSQPAAQPGISQVNPFMQQQLATLQAQAQQQAQAQAAPPQPQGIEAAMQQQPQVMAAHGGAIQRFQAGGGPQFSLSNTPPDQQLFLLYSLLSDPRLSDDEKIGIKQYIKDTFQRGTVPTAPPTSQIKEEVAQQLATRQPAPGMLDTLPKPQPAAQSAAPAFPGAAQAETDPDNPAFSRARYDELMRQKEAVLARKAPTPYTEEQAYIDAAKGMQTMPWAEKRSGIAALQAEQDKILERQRQLYEKSKEGDTFNRWMALLGGAGRRGVGGGADAVEAFEDKLKQREAGFTQQMVQNRDFMQEMQKVAQSATADEYNINLKQALAKAKDYDQAATLFMHDQKLVLSAINGELGVMAKAFAQKYVADQRTEAAATRAGAGGDPVVKQKLAAMKADPRYAGIKKQLEDTAKFASSTSPVIRQQYAAAQEAYIRFMQSHGLTPSDVPEEFPGVSSGTPGVTPGAAPAGWGKATLVR